MGKFYETLITSTVKADRLSAIAEFIGALPGFTYEEDSIILQYQSWDAQWHDMTFNGIKFTVTDTNITGFYGIGDSYGNTAVYLKKGTVDLIPAAYHSDGSGSINLSINAYVDDNCVEFAINSPNTRFDGMEFIIAKDINLVGYLQLFSNTSQYVDIASLVFEKTDPTLRAKYTYANMFPYTASAGTLDYAVGGVFVNGDQYREFRLETMVECSTVSLLSTQSLLIGNYLALGAHCLVPLDEEE